MSVIRRIARRNDLPLSLRYLRYWLVRWKHEPNLFVQEFGVAASNFPRWLRSFRGNIDPMKWGMPWITLSAVPFLAGRLSRRAEVFEYGSGGSTVFYARHARRVVAVEHDAAWAGRVRAALRELGLRNAECLHAPPEPAGEQVDPICPHAYGSCQGGEFTRCTFRNYVTAIDRFPDGSFDLVSVDGRARPSCVQHARRKVKRGGYLVLDNSERPHYKGIHEAMSEWRTWEFAGPLLFAKKFDNHTTVWQRPVNAERQGDAKTSPSQLNGAVPRGQS